MTGLQSRGRAATSSTRGAVAAGSELAMEAGVDVLRSGGNAVDAVIAGAYVQSVVEVPWGGAGGDAFVMVHSASGEVGVLNGSGASPLKLAAKVDFEQSIPRFGALSVAVPGFFAALETTHARFGTRPLLDLVAPAVRLAEQGFEASEHLVAAAERIRPALSVDDPLAVLLDQLDGTHARTLRQPSLADTLVHAVSAGAQDFYSDIGEGLARRIWDLGGALSPDDFAAHRCEWTEPIRGSYRDVEVYTHPPVSLGCILLIQLGLYERLGLEHRHPEDPVRLDAMIRCKRRAFAAALPVLLDPEVDLEAATRLLDPDHLDKLAVGLLDTPVKALDSVATSEDGTDTTCVAAVDDEGNFAVIIHSLFNEFGSRLLDPETGLLLNDRLANQRLSRNGGPGLVPGGKPIHTLNAVLAQRDGLPLVMMATPGGRGQVQTTFQVLVNMVDGGDDPQQAIDAPRWLSGAPRRPAPNDQVYLEPSTPSTSVDELRRRGHEVIVTDGSATDLYGSCVAVAGRAGGPVYAAADHRRAAVSGGI